MNLFSIVLGTAFLVIAIFLFLSSKTIEEKEYEDECLCCDCEEDECGCHLGECCADCCECECKDCCNGDCCVDCCDCEEDQCCADCCECECKDCCNGDCCQMFVPWSDQLKDEDEEELDDLLVIPTAEDIFTPSPSNSPVTVRLMPPKNGQKFYEVARTHRLSNKVVPCGRKKVNQKWVDDCPICDHYVQLWKESDEALFREDKINIQAEAKLIKPVERYYYNALVNTEPKVFKVGKSLHEKIVTSIVGDSLSGIEALGDVTHPDTGRDFNVLCNIRGELGLSFPDYRDSFFTGVRPLTEDERKLYSFEISSLQPDCSVEELQTHLNEYLARG